jgi:4-amino-4-deoxy-L-arabinose transferase-like glycosyltransferase
VRGERPLRFVSRLPTVAAFALLLATVFVVGRRFLGETAASLVTAACALDPNLIANSAVASVDTPYALATLLALGALLWLAEEVSLPRGLALGAALGLAFAVKFTAFLLVPGVLVFPLLVPALRARLISRRLAVAAMAAALAALFVVAAAYRFHDVGLELNDVGWRSPLMMRLAARLPHLRLASAGTGASAAERPRWPRAGWRCSKGWWRRSSQSSLTSSGSSLTSARPASRGKWAASASPTRATPFTIPSV